MICIIGSESTKNYGLLTDLWQAPDCRVVYTRPPIGYGTAAWDIAWKLIRRLKLPVNEDLHVHMAWEKTVLKRLGSLDRIVVVDTALRWLEPSFLDRCRALKPELRIDCLLLNSTKSVTFSRPKVHRRFHSFRWDTVLTFDPHDAETYGWQYIGLHYYSRRAVPAADGHGCDLFFAGSILGKRGELLLQLLDRFRENGVKCRFLCPCLSRRQVFSKQPEGLHLLWKRISYKRMLKKMMDCNCILEVMQEGQRGSTLRYFEAVCYGKKLLTTNADIKNYPFYDERYMKVFSSMDDIDFAWVKKREAIDYGYKNEFSPIYLFQAQRTE